MTKRANSYYQTTSLTNKLLISSKYFAFQELRIFESLGQEILLEKQITEFSSLGTAGFPSRVEKGGDLSPFPEGGG